jgi:hypothetical protein
MTAIMYTPPAFTLCSTGASPTSPVTVPASGVRLCILPSEGNDTLRYSFINRRRRNGYSVIDALLVRDTTRSDDQEREDSSFAFCSP